MATQEKSGHFIGRREEIQLFKDWLQNPHSPWILYFYDSTEKQEKKGGIGKTWLLRECAKVVSQECPDIAVLMVDFFSVEDRDRLFLAEKVVKSLHRFCPEWYYTAFAHILEQYRSKQLEATLSKRSTGVAEEETTFTVIAAALVEDIQRLEPILELQQKTLLLVFDTFELIEDNPIIAVLRHSQKFPDNYGSSHMKVLMAGRNRLNWQQPGWLGRQSEVQEEALRPFNEQEMLAYIDREAIYSQPPQEQSQIAALYDRTEGRPIMIGLVVDVLNNRLQSLEELLAVAASHFEQNLVPQVNKLENPLNWVILWMAHAYHHFNIALLKQILSQIRPPEPIRSVSLDEIAERLPQLSFVRASSTDDSFMLHDEMRRLVIKYCWEGLDPDKRQRKDISRCVIDFYKQELDHSQNEAWQQLCYLVVLHHSLFIDLDDGLQHFKRHFQTASRLRKRGFARLLLQEVQNAMPTMSLAQRNDIQLQEVQLLRLEDAPDDALNVLEQIKNMKDPQWYEANYYEILTEQGRCYQKKNLWDDAERCFNECLLVETERNNQSHCAFLLNLLGYIARRRGQFATALTRYQQSANVYKRLENRSNYALVLNNMSFVYRYQGKTDEALLRCKLGLRIRRNLFQDGEIDEVPVGLSLSTLGVIYLFTGNISEAEAKFQEAYELYSHANSKADIAATYNRFGQVEFARSNLDKALSWFAQAQQAAVEANVEHYITSLIWQGRIYIQQQRWPEAQTLFELAIERAQQVADDFQFVEGLIYLADCQAAQGQGERAQQLLLEAEQRASQRSYYELWGRVEFRRGEIVYLQDAFQQAFQHFVAYCHYMALYNYAEYSNAVQHLVDALIRIPAEFTESIVDDIKNYWQAHHLDTEYHELISQCEEVKVLL